MVFSFATTTREVLEQVVREPRFRAVSTPPLVSLHEVGLIALVYLVFGASTWAWMAGHLHWLPMMALNAIFIYVAFTPLHDSAHRSLSSNRTLNDLLGTISSLILFPGLTARFYRYLHLEHHRHTGNKELDPDEMFVAAKGLKALLVLAAPEIHWLGWYFKRWSERPISERVEAMSIFSFFILLHVVALSSPYAVEFVMAWMIPQRLGAVILVRSFARIQHPEGVRWEDAPFQTTYRVETNLFGKVFMLGQAVHCLHHLAPNVPYYRYHEAWNLGRHLFEKQNVPIRTMWSEPAKIDVPSSTQQSWLHAKVESVRLVGTDIQSYCFVPQDDNEQWPSFTPGSHIDVKLDEGLVRQYSLCNDPAEKNRYVIAVKKDVEGRGGSMRVHTDIHPGDVIEIGQPRNHFPLEMTHDHYVLVAGGIGITPLLSMAYALHRARKRFELHICARDLEAAPFSELLHEACFAASVHLYLDNAELAQRFEARSALGIFEPGHALYLCGPGGFMAHVMSVGEELGWPQEAMCSETFAPPQVDVSENKPFEVHLARSRKTYTVLADEFLIDVLHNNGHPVMCSCTQGICGSCITPVLEGVPEHRDAVMSDAERDSNAQMCVCVSRARSERLVLDI